MSDLNPELREPIVGTAHNEPVLIASPQSQEEAEVIRATLDAEGIVATLQVPAPNVNNETFGELGLTGVYVAASDAEAAQAILNQTPPTEDELSDEALEGETLEEAEARVKAL